MSKSPEGAAGPDTCLTRGADDRAPLDPASLLPLWIGATMALAAMLAALSAVIWFGLPRFPMIAQACAINGLTDVACTAGAWSVGEMAAIAFTVVLAAGVGIERLAGGKRPAPTPALPAWGIGFVLIAAFGVLLVHLVALTAGPAFASRSDESEHYAALISIENLLWPLLLQLYLSQPDRRLRACLLSVLLVVMALSPYRAVLLAIVIFGFAVPLIQTAWRAIRAGRPKAFSVLYGRRGAVVLALGVAAVWGGYVATETRFPSLYVAEQAEGARAREIAAPANGTEHPAPQVAPDAASVVTALPPIELGPRIAQRLAFPLYQAAIAGHLAGLVPLPDLWNELGRKFRLSDQPTLGEFLFRRIYGGTTGDQTTTLYFGEAVAYAPGPPVVWMILGPLAIVAAGLLFRSARMASQTVLGVGLWRSSFSGLAPVLPALILQLGALGSLAALGRLSAARPRFEQVAHRIARHGVAIMIALVLAAQLWAIAATPARRTLVIATFSVAAGCTLVSPSWITARVDDALAAHRLRARSSLAWAVGNSFAVTLSLGPQAMPALADVAGRVATLVVCGDGAPTVAVTLADARRFGAVINPLDGLAALGLLVALLGLTGVPLRTLPVRAKALVERLPARHAELTLGARFAVLAGLGAVFLLLARASEFDAPLAMAACATLLAGSALTVPRLGLALVIFCTPIRALFELPQERMQVVLAAGLIGVAVRHAPLLASFLRSRSPPIVTLLCAFTLVFAVRTTMEVLQVGSDDPWALAKEAVFYATLIMAALAASWHARDPRFAGDLLGSVALAVIVTIAIDAIDLYFPISAEGWGLLKGYPSLRFSGLHVNPNATGKYLIFGVLMSCSALWAVRGRFRMGLGLLGAAVATLAITATLSKSALLAVFGALAVFAIQQAAAHRWRNAAMVLATAGLVAAAVGTWYAGFASWTYAYTLQKYAEMKRLSPEARAQVQAMTEQSTAVLVERELRVGESYAMTLADPAIKRQPNSEMYRKIPGAVVYTKRDCGWACTGQRDRLWGTGLAIVADHWLLGIGPHRWADEYLKRLSFPFDTPHNALLELWGGYGLAGAALYLALVVQLLRLAVQGFRRGFQGAPQSTFLVGTSLATVAMLLGELVDPAKFLSMNPHAVWLWIFVPAQAALLSSKRESEL